MNDSPFHDGSEGSPSTAFEAVVLCGGLGTRLRPVVSDRAKPMATIGDKPFLALLLDFFARQGVGRFVLAAGHKAESIGSYLETTDLPYKVTLSIEKERLGTGGALALARSRIASFPVAVLNGDSFCGLDIRSMARFHTQSRAMVTIAVTRISPVGEYGEVVFDGTGSISAFTEKSGAEGEGWVNAGIYVFSREAFDRLPATPRFSLEKDFFPAHTGRGLFAFQCGAPLLDIGTPERLDRARAILTGQGTLS